MSAGSSQRVGLIGCGVISSAYAKKLDALSEVELVACADLERERAQALADRFEIPQALEPKALLDDDGIDLVLNLTVPLAHAEVSLAAIQAGKSVYSEKPLTVDFAEGQRLEAAAQQAGVRLGCAPDTFLGAGLQTCRRLIDDGAIGEPVGANAFMLSPGPERWHPAPQIFYQRGAGPLFDMGPYYLTALVFLLGPVRRVTAAARITHATREIKSKPLAGQHMPVDAPTHVATLAEFSSGPIATLVTSFDVQASRHRSIEIYGTEGTLAVPDPNTFGGPVQIRRPGDQAWTDVPLTHANGEQARGIGLGDMAVALRSGRPHRASGALALHVLEIMQGSLGAAETGERVELTTTCERPAPLPTGLADDAFDD